MPLNAFKSLIATTLVLFISIGVQAKTHKPKPRPIVPAQLQFTPEFIFAKVLERKNQVLKQEVPFPKIFLQTKTPLNQFQDAVEPQWGFRPDVFTNAFANAKNEIYLMDDSAYYKKVGRCMDDSLAHELTHYVQSKYQNFDLNDESLEMDAVDVQTWFRETFCKIKN